MIVKIDTKESFSVFRLQASTLTEKMADEIKKAFLEKSKEMPGNAILDISNTSSFTPQFFNILEEIQSTFTDSKLSFVCAPVTGTLKKKYPQFNNISHAPTLQEATHLVMMENLERELLNPGSME